MEPVPELVLGVLNHLKTPLMSYSLTRDVKTALFSRGNRYFLVAVNNGNEDKSAMIYLPRLAKIKGKMVVSDLMSGEKNIYTKDGRNPLSISISRKDGRVLELSFSGA